MVNRQVAHLPAAVLTGVVIPAENFFACQLDDRTGASDHLPQANHGWQGKCLRDRVNDPSTVQD